MSELGGAKNSLRRRLGDRGALQPAPPTTTAAPLVDPAITRARRFIRSADLREAVRQVDTAPSAVAQAEIVEWIQQAYAQQGVGVLVGMFSHCYLGAPYVDHVLTLAGSIVQHYQSSDAVPVEYLPARPLAISEQYAFIEIYADGTVIPIRHDGSAAI
jgi:hypothetical protein